MSVRFFFLHNQQNTRFKEKDYKFNLQ